MKKCYLIICLILCLKLTWAQQSAENISVNFKAVKLEQVVAELELKSGYRFFYNPVQVDNLRITLAINEEPLQVILEQAFLNTDFHYAITAQHQVLITKGRMIQTSLASGYFKGENLTNQTAVITGFIDDIDKQVIVATMENKLYEIGLKTNQLKQGVATLAGYVKDIKSGEAVNGANVMFVNSKVNAITDQYGYYSVTIPRGKQLIIVKGLGMRDARRQLMLYNSGNLNIEMQEQITTLKEVQVSAEKVANVKSAELGVNRLDIKSIKQVPAVFGEADVLRVILTLPGVQSVGEATTGFNVRGGSADQNLILLNGATIYNPAHFFGFFSAFNPDIVKDVQLYKSSIPEKYGGRLSSVLDVTDREGNKKKFTGSAGIGLLTSRFNIEGPIIKDKTSFIFGGRTTYSDWLLKLLPQDYKNSQASFYDLNLDISHQINERNNIYITSYLSNDHFKLNSDTAYAYSNRNLNIKWKHNFSNILYGVFMLGTDHYQYSISSFENPVNAYKLGFNINQNNFKSDFTYYVNPKHTVDFGLSSILYNLNPGDFKPNGSQSLVSPNIVPKEKALESAFYIGDKYDITPNLLVNLGLRYSLYNYLGPQTVNYYAPNLPRESVNLIDSTTYKKNQVINAYYGPEIRASVRYNLANNLSIKAGYNTLRQYLHLLSNTTSISPTDVYKLSDPNIKPQYGDQVSLGLYHNVKSNTIELSVEVYYKRLKDYLDYKSGATLVLNHHVETDVIGTRGKAYGAEFLVRKTAGKLNGWMSYTYSRTFLQQNDPTLGDLINGGKYYPANYDKPHDFNFTGNYRFSHRFSISLNATYSTGRPITLPIAKYFYAGSERVLYSDRNLYRIPDYFRSDFSMNIEGNHKVHQRFHNSFTIGVYNLTGRQNAYSTYFAEQGGAINGYQLSIFARPIPFINYNIRF